MSKAELLGSTSLTQADPLKADFRKFVYVIWKHLGLPDPTPLQYDIAWSMQHGRDREMIQAFRGAAKSWIAAAFVLWTLYCDAQKKILVVSAAEPLAKNFTTFCLQLIRDVPILKHLAPRREQRQSALEFDVGPARPAKDPSVTARGITGQITGTRAHVLVADDVEITRNSATETMREGLRENIKEFDAIILPDGRILYLGTPQSHNSIYKKLPERGYHIRVWPAQIPTAKQAAKYGAALAPFIKKLMQKGKPGTSVEPTRFSDEDLAARKRSWGSDGFGLQYLLDTSLTDENRFPLKLRDLIVMGAIDRERGPEHLVYAAEQRTEQSDLPMVGMDRDRYYGPAMVSPNFAPFSSVLMQVDPSGRGKDDTAYAILAELNGFIYILKTGGFAGGYEPETLASIAAKCVEYRVGLLRIEDNFGDGMFTTLLTPHVVKAWEQANAGKREEFKGGTSVEGFKTGNVQKEQRIIASLGPALQSHRVVTSRDVIFEDYTDCEKREGDDRYTYSAFFQLSHLTRDKGCLAHDDKLDAIAAGVAHYTAALGINPEEIAKEAADERWEKELARLTGDDDDELRALGYRGERVVGLMSRGGETGLGLRRH